MSEKEGTSRSGGSAVPARDVRAKGGLAVEGAGVQLHDGPAAVGFKEARARGGEAGMLDDGIVLLHPVVVDPAEPGVTLLIDAMSYQYLVGAKIDFKEGLSGEQFVIDNPNAVTTCGCGSSFSV